jgi:hypothetical protein
VQRHALPLGLDRACDAHVPMLGPVRWEDPLPELFEAVVEAAGTGGFLPYDKDRR